MGIKVLEGYRPEGLHESDVADAVIVNLGSLRTELTVESMRQFLEGDQIELADAIRAEQRSRLTALGTHRLRDHASAAKLRECGLAFGGLFYWPPLVMRFNPGTIARCLASPGRLQMSHRLDQASLYFDGFFFAVAAETPEIPVITDLGQIARDLLLEALSGSARYVVKGVIPPSPIRETIFLARVKEESATRVCDGKPTLSRGALVVPVPHSEQIQAAVERVFAEARLPLCDYYLANAAGGELEEAVSDLRVKTEGLAELVLASLNQPWYRRWIGYDHVGVRRAMAGMHWAFQRVASLESRVRTSRASFERTVATADTLRYLRLPLGYEYEGSATVDRETILNLMSFAAGEVSTYRTNKSVVTAAVVGAIAGAFAGFVAQW